MRINNPRPSNQVTEQVRKAAFVWKANKDKSIEREVVITNAQKKWEMMKSQTTSEKTLLTCSAVNDVQYEEIIPLTESLPLSARTVKFPQRAEFRRNVFMHRRAVSQQVCIRWRDVC